MYWGSSSEEIFKCIITNSSIVTYWRTNDDVMFSHPDYVISFLTQDFLICNSETSVFFVYVQSKDENDVKDSEFSKTILFVRLGAC